MDHSILCCLCNGQPYDSLVSLNYHLMYQHSTEDLSLALIALSNKFLFTPLSLRTPQFDAFFSRHPYLWGLSAPSVDPLANIFSLGFQPLAVSNPSNSGLELQEQQRSASPPPFPDSLASSSGAHIQTWSDRTFGRPRLPSSQQTTEIDVVGFSQGSGVDANEPDNYDPPQEEKQAQIVPNPRKFNCDECSKSYKLKAHLTRHKATAHSELSPHECEFCNKRFKVKEQLNLHLGSHKVLNPFSCSLCPMKFAKASFLKQHVRSNHENSRRKCSDCNFVFASEAMMRQHASKAHNAAKENDAAAALVICDTCKKTFASKQNLISHMKCHRLE